MNFPIMKGEARMAVGMASRFEVPLFSPVLFNLWQGCSPAEFPDELEPFDYSLYSHGAYQVFCKIEPPIKCRWLWDESVDEDGNPGPPVPRFDKILNLYPWGEYVVPELTEMVEVIAYDSHDVDYNSFQNGAILAMEWLEEGYKVLVHCQAGLNRSSFVVALILMELYKMSPDEAINHIRKTRSNLCLCNDHFRQYLKGLK